EIFAAHLMDGFEVFHVADIDVDANDIVERAAGLFHRSLHILADLTRLNRNIAQARDGAVGHACGHAGNENHLAGSSDGGGLREMGIRLGQLGGGDLVFHCFSPLEFGDQSAASTSTPMLLPVAIRLSKVWWLSVQMPAFLSRVA